MKLIASLIVLPSAALLFSSCVVVEDPPNDSSSPAMSANARASQNVYDLGYQRGLSDGRGGLSRTPTRYAEARGSESDAFTIGYEKGYNEGIR
jgi:hypothetical protein